MLLQAGRPIVEIDWREGVLELYIQPPHFTKFEQPRPAHWYSPRTVLQSRRPDCCAYTTAII